MLLHSLFMLRIKRMCTENARVSGSTQVRINPIQVLRNLDLDKEINIRPYVYAVDNKGITARWRGSALAWPILDAQISPYNNQILCALHRGDAFISVGKINAEKKVAAYKWISLPDLKEQMLANPNDFTIWFKIIITSYIDKFQFQ